MPATNAGPAPRFDPQRMRSRVRDVMDLPAEEIDAIEAEMHPDEARAFRAIMAEEYERQAQSDTTIAREADTQTWQASLGTDRFGNNEAPTDLQVLVNTQENPQTLRANLESITKTGRTLPSIVAGEGLGETLDGVPKGTEFSVREAQDGSGIDVVYRLPDSQEWNQYDPPGISGRNVMAFLRENLTLPNITAAVADATAAGRVGAVGRMAVSAGTGAAARAVDEMQEPGPQTGAEIGGEAVESGVFGAVGSVVGDAAGAVGNALTGRGLRTTQTELQERVAGAQQRFEARGWDPLTLSETGDPIQRAAAATAASTGRLEAARQERRLRQPLDSIIREAGSESIADVPLKVLQDTRDAAYEDAARKFSAGLSELQRTGVLKSTTPEQFGRRTQEAYSDVVRAEKEIGGRLFDQAIETAQRDGVVFNLDPFIKDVQKWRELVELRGMPQEQLGFPDPTVRVDPGTPDRVDVVGTAAFPATRRVQRTDAQGKAVLDAQGRPVYDEVSGEVVAPQTRTVPGRPAQNVVEQSFGVPVGEVETTVKWAQGYRPQFAQLFAIVDDLNPEQPATYLEGIRRIQSWLGGMSDPKDGMIVDPEAIRVASALSAKLDESIRGTPGAEGFNAALDHSKEYWDRILKFQRTMGLFQPKGEQTASYGEQVYRAFAGGDAELLTEQGALAALKVLRHRPNGLVEFRGAVARDALRNPDRINALLQTIDIVRGLPNGQEIFPVSLRNALEAYRARLANADYGQLDAQIKAYESGAKTAATMIERGNVDEIRMLLRQKVWTVDQLRGYVLGRLAEQSEETGATRGARILDPGRYNKELERLRAAGILELLPASSRALLEDVKLMTEFIDTSDSLSTGAMASGSINVGRAANAPVSPAALWQSYKQAKLAARAWLGSQPRFVALMGYGSKPPTDWRMTREVARLATEALARSNPRTDLSTQPSQPLSAEQPEE